MRMKKLMTVWVDEWPKCIEEPTVTIEFLLILFFQTENDLHWTCPLRNFASIGDDYTRSVSERTVRKDYSEADVFAYSKMWAVTSFPPTESFAIPSWYSPI